MLHVQSRPGPLQVPVPGKPQPTGSAWFGPSWLGLSPLGPAHIGPWPLLFLAPPDAPGKDSVLLGSCNGSNCWVRVELRGESSARDPFLFVPQDPLSPLRSGPPPTESASSSPRSQPPSFAPS